MPIFSPLDGSKDDVRGHIEQRAMMPERLSILCPTTIVTLLVLSAPLGMNFAPESIYIRFTSPGSVSLYERSRDLLVPFYFVILWFYFPNASIPWIKSVVEKLISRKY